MEVRCLQIILNFIQKYLLSIFKNVSLSTRVNADRERHIFKDP